MQELIGFSKTSPHDDYFISAIKHALWSFVEDPACTVMEAIYQGRESNKTAD